MLCPLKDVVLVDSSGGTGYWRTSCLIDIWTLLQQGHSLASYLLMSTFWYLSIVKRLRCFASQKCYCPTRKLSLSLWSYSKGGGVVEAEQNRGAEKTRRRFTEIQVALRLLEVSVLVQSATSVRAGLQPVR